MLIESFRPFVEFVKEYGVSIIMREHDFKSQGARLSIQAALRCALAFTGSSVDYVDQQQEEACIDNRGVHGHDCVPAWKWRAQQRAETGQ